MCIKNVYYNIDTIIRNISYCGEVLTNASYWVRFIEQQNVTKFSRQQKSTV